MALTQNYKLNVIQWYPGHIAKAEKNLKEQLKRVDVVLEVRDVRIPLATHHPQIEEWVGSKTRLLVINRVDMISPQVRSLWIDWFRNEGETPYFTNAQHGQGVVAVCKAAQAGWGRTQSKKTRSRNVTPSCPRCCHWFP